MPALPQAQLVVGGDAGHYAFCGLDCLGVWFNDVLAGVEGGLELGAAIERVERAAWERERWR